MAMQKPLPTMSKISRVFGYWKIAEPPSYFVVE